MNQDCDLIEGAPQMLLEAALARTHTTKTPEVTTFPNPYVISTSILVLLLNSPVPYTWERLLYTVNQGCVHYTALPAPHSYHVQHHTLILQKMLLHSISSPES